MSARCWWAEGRGHPGGGGGTASNTTHFLTRPYFHICKYYYALANVSSSRDQPPPFLMTLDT